MPHPLTPRRVRARAAGAGLAAVLAATVGCGPVDVTRARLQNDLGPTFENMYVLQQRLLGNGNVNPPAATGVARCSKGGPSVPDRGPGDWLCQVRWPGPDGIVRPLGYDVRVQPTGCYTAQGPASFVGQQLITTQGGGRVTNPLFEFDGCFDTT